MVRAASAGRILGGLDVDIVHDHSLAGPLLAFGRDIPTVVTVHGTVSGEAGGYYRQLGDRMRLVAISDAQRRTAPDLNLCATVHNAINAEDFPFREEKEDWVLFLGRCTPDKGMHLTMDAAGAADRESALAAKCTEPAEISCPPGRPWNDRSPGRARGGRYDFSAPAVRPEMIRRCANITISTTGMVTMTTAASMRL